MFELVVTDRAAAALRTIPAKIAQKIMATMRAIAANPFGSHPQAKRLTGSNGFRARVGDWRALYTIDQHRKAVVLRDVVKRGEAYR